MRITRIVALKRRANEFQHQSWDIVVACSGGTQRATKRHLTSLACLPERRPTIDELQHDMNRWPSCWEEASL